MSPRLIVLYLFVFSTLLATGCGGKERPEGFPKLYPCTIVVKQDKTPLAGATVMLFSEDGSVNWTVGGGTDGTGTATIFTHGDFEGAPLGKYKVAVTKNIIENAPTQEQLNNPSFSGPRGEAFDYVDLKYKTKDSTPLTIEITSGKNTQEYDVGAAIHEKVKIR